MKLAEALLIRSDMQKELAQDLTSQEASLNPKMPLEAI